REEISGHEQSSEESVRRRRGSPDLVQHAWVFKEQRLRMAGRSTKLPLQIVPIKERVVVHTTHTLPYGAANDQRASGDPLRRAHRWWGRRQSRFAIMLMCAPPGCSTVRASAEPEFTGIVVEGDPQAEEIVVRVLLTEPDELR